MKKILTVVAVLGMTTQAMGGDITGKVVFEGKAPAPTRLRMDADKVCARIHTTPVMSEEVVVNKNGTLKNVLVYVKDGLGGKKFDPPKEKAVLDQIGCVYKPHVLGIMVGQELEILNSDPTLHNVHSLSKANPKFNVAMPMKGMKLNKKFDKVETFKVKCEVHPWMGAYIGVFNHPYFAVTDDNGNYTIKGLPAGEYTIETWHEKYGTQTMKVAVGATDKKTADFKYAGK
jgi:plastocyanin